MAAEKGTHFDKILGTNNPKQPTVVIFSAIVPLKINCHCNRQMMSVINSQLNVLTLARSL